MYPRHRHFRPPNHPLRKRGKHFGEAEKGKKPTLRSGADVFDMVKDLKVIFGKGPDSLRVPNDAKGHTPMWKKIYILGDTLLGNPRGPLLYRCDARDEESLLEPSSPLGCVWEE